MRVAFWCPSWGTPCGIAEYTKHLVDYLDIPVYNSLPPYAVLRELDILHVQHEWGIFQDTETFTELLNVARMHGARTLVTAHSVDQSPRYWETASDGLIALTERGTALIKDRWASGKIINYIPHGCPTWFPKKKETPGRVIGAFGFLEGYKGYWELLEALPRVANASAVLYAHARDARMAVRWERDSANLPVVRHNEFFSAEEAVTRLAQEADVLLCWHRKTPMLSASGSIRVAMSTGLPVLARQGTSWTDGLGDAVYRTRDLATGLTHLLNDPDLRESISSNAKEYCLKNSWEKNADLHRQVWAELIQQVPR